MKRILFAITGILLAAAIIVACNKSLVFPESHVPLPPQVKQSEASLLWIGPDYRVAFSADLEDTAGITKVQVKNGEWQIDTVYVLNGQDLVNIIDTITVTKDANRTEHVLEFIITNRNGGVVKANVVVEDLSATNQIPGYDPDVLPPSITVASPAATITKHYGFTNDPVPVYIDATVTDDEIATIEVKVWGETAAGEPVSHEQIITPATEDEKENYHVNLLFELPGGKVGQYQYIVRSTDASGNKSVKGGEIHVGMIDRLYLSDAETEDEVLNQGYDHYGACRGIGTLLSMKQQGANVFVVDYYYRNEASDNIRFIAFLGSAKPFSSDQSAVRYSLSDTNVVAMSSTESGKIVTDLSQAGFKLPVSSKGYYRITVNMTARTISAVPFTPSKNLSDATLYPGWSDSNPWPYMAVTGPVVVGSAGGWTEVATSPQLVREADHPYLFTGTFQTNGTSSNISLNAPLSANADVWGKGWFRMPAARTAMRDDYNDLITKVAPVGASSGGANWGFSLSNFGNATGTFKATYDLLLDRFRVVRIGD